LNSIVSCTPQDLARLQIPLSIVLLVLLPVLPWQGVLPILVCMLLLRQATNVGEFRPTAIICGLFITAKAIMSFLTFGSDILVKDGQLVALFLCFLILVNVSYSEKHGCEIDTLLLTLLLYLLWVCSHQALSDEKHPSVPISFVVANDVSYFAILSPLFRIFLRRDQVWKLVVAIYFSSLFWLSIEIESRLSLTLSMISLVTLINFRKSPYVILPVLAIVALGLSFYLLGDKPLDGVLARLELWAFSAGLLLDTPVSGFGTHSFGELYSNLVPTELMSDSRQMNWPHNLFLEIGIEQGVIVLALFCALTATLTYRLSGSISGIVTLLFLSTCLVEASLSRLWVISTLFLLLVMERLDYDS